MAPKVAAQQGTHRVVPSPANLHARHGQWRDLLRRGMRARLQAVGEAEGATQAALLFLARAVVSAAEPAVRRRWPLSRIAAAANCRCARAGSALCDPNKGFTLLMRVQHLTIVPTPCCTLHVA